MLRGPSGTATLWSAMAGATELPDVDALLALELLPALEDFSLEAVVAQLRPVTALLARALETREIATTARAVDMVCAASILLGQLRALAADPDALVAALLRVMEPAAAGGGGLAALLNKVVECKREVIGVAADPLPAELAVSLVQLWVRAAWVWPAAHPEPKVPSCLETWELIVFPGEDADRVGRFMLSERLPEILGIASSTSTSGAGTCNLQRAAVLRAAVPTYLVFAIWTCPECFAKNISVLAETGLISKMLGLMDELHPCPASPGEPDDLASAAADTDGVVWAAFQSVFGSFAGLQNYAQAHDPAFEKVLATHLIDSGVVGYCLRALRSFAALPAGPASANPIMALVAGLLQNVALPDGCHVTALQKVAEDGGATAADLHSYLMQAIDAGEQTPPAITNIPLHLKAANALACLFGREEDDGTITVPTAVITGLAETLAYTIRVPDPSDSNRQGQRGNLISSVTCLTIVSISDANTQALVDSGVLDTIGTVLQDSQAEVDKRGTLVGYNVKGAREACLRMLLNLSLCIGTTTAVAQHQGVQRGLESAAADRDGLTKTAGQLLADVRFQLNMTSGHGVEEALERVKKVAKRGLMMSYCCELQCLIGFTAMLPPPCRRRRRRRCCR